MLPQPVYLRGGILRLISPTLNSGGASGDVTSFLAGLVSKVPPQHVETIERDSALGVPERDDVVVVFVPSPPGGGWRPSVRSYLQRALEVGADVIPVALDRGQRPPVPLQELNPFSVQETIESYHLGRGQLREAGSVFARVAVSRLWPTYSRERLQLFLSYTRADGVDLVRSLASAITDLNHRPSRDFADVRAGSQVAASVARELNESDVLVLCDTPRCSDDHPWLKDELCVALGLGLPIVWARFGQTGTKSGLPIKPADKPDLDVDWPTTTSDFHAIVAQILDVAFVAGRNQVRRIESCITKARESMTVGVLDARRRIMLLERPRRLGPFKLTDRIVLQAYARRPLRQDGEALLEWLRSAHLISDDGSLRAFDLAVMMAPSPPSDLVVHDESPAVTEVADIQSSHGRSLVAALALSAASRAARPENRELLLFAGIGPGQGARQEFRDAVQDIAIFWLGRGGRIRFGGHPTVTPTVNWAARSEVRGREREHVVIYQSEYFVTPQLLSEISQIATVVGTEVQGAGTDARQQSLTHMRERMVRESAAVAALVIGGLTPAEAPDRPGVEEEMLLAQGRGIPIFILGATGGEAAILVDQAREQDPPFAVLGNGLSPDENEFLATTDDYSRAADIIWTATN